MQVMKFGQLIEYVFSVNRIRIKNVFFKKNGPQNVMEKLVPDIFLEN